MAENYLVPAERVLANKDVFTIDVELLEKDMAAWLIPDPPAAAAVEVKPDSQPESQKAEEPGAAPLPDQSEPDPVEEPLSFAAEGPPARAETFRMLVLNRCQQDMLDRLSADAWEKALLQATTSASVRDDSDSMLRLLQKLKSRFAGPRCQNCQHRCRQPGR